MTHSGDNAGAKAGNFLKEGWAKFHGAGEALRGNVNTFADDITNTDDTRSRAVAQKGEAEFESGIPQHRAGEGAGVTPNDTERHVGVGANSTGVGHSTTGVGHHTTGLGSNTGVGGTTETTGIDGTRRI